MKVDVTLSGAANEPNGVVIVLPDWSLGGPRKTIKLSLWEALQVRAALDRLLIGERG